MTTKPSKWSKVEAGIYVDQYDNMVMRVNGSWWAYGAPGSGEGLTGRKILCAGQRTMRDAKTYVPQPTAAPKPELVERTDDRPINADDITSGCTLVVRATYNRNARRFQVDSFDQPTANGIMFIEGTERTRNGMLRFRSGRAELRRMFLVFMSDIVAVIKPA